RRRRGARSPGRGEHLGADRESSDGARSAAQGVTAGQTGLGPQVRRIDPGHGSPCRYGMTGRAYGGGADRLGKRWVRSGDSRENGASPGWLASGTVAGRAAAHHRGLSYSVGSSIDEEGGTGNVRSAAESFEGSSESGDEQEER